MNSKDTKEFDNIIFLDSATTQKDLKKIIEELNNFKIIVFDIESKKNLSEHNMEYIISDDYLNDDELENIQKNSYYFSEWYDKNEIKNEIIFENVNVGRLFHEQFIEFLVKTLKKYKIAYNIYKKYPNSNFFASGILFEIIKEFTKNSKKISENIKEEEFVFDKVRFDLRVGNRYFMIMIPKNIFLKLKNMLEILLRLFFRPDKKTKNKVSLLVEIHSERYKELFYEAKKFSLGLLYYGRRRPAIWDLSTFKIFRKSNCKIIFETMLKDNKFEMIKNEKSKIFESKIRKLWENEEFFSKYFSKEGILSWNVIKPTLKKLIHNRKNEIINEIELTKRLFEKNKFESVVVFQEVGLTEQIVITFAKKENIPIILLQQGLYYDTKEAVIANRTMTVYPRNSDKFAVWGEIAKEDAYENAELSSEMISIVGAPRYDRIESIDCVTKEEFVLIAAQGPAYNYVQGHLIKNFEIYEKTISEICKTILKHGKKIVIKLHPSPREYDITNLVKGVSNEIEVVTTGDIIPLIKSCSFMISMGLSTSIIEAQILHKPVIAIPVLDYKMGIPRIFKSNSCIVCNTKNFQNKLEEILVDEKLKNDIRKNGDEFVNKYLKNYKTSSKEFIELLKSI